MFDRPFPRIFDELPTVVTVPEAAMLELCGYLLGEDVILSWQDPPESPRPASKYTCLRTLQDIHLARARSSRVSLRSATDPLPDLRETTVQRREALIRATCYGPQALARAVRLSVGYASPGALPYWGTCGLQVAGKVTDAARTLGQHHEGAAFIDFQVRYRMSVADDVYSIQTLTLTVTPS